jgi:hypothetical protein
VGALLAGGVAWVSAAGAGASCLLVPGDFDDNGAATVVDVQCHVLGVLADIAGEPDPSCLEWPHEAFDLDCSGEVTVADVQLTILIVLAGPGGWAPQIDADGDLCADACGCAPSPEICDGIDNDCDGVIPEDELDLDWDNFAPCDGDCDDSDPLAYPGKTEVLDGIDNDCDGLVDDLSTKDADGDGWSPADGDCCDTKDDCTDPSRVNPGAFEVVGNYVDDDCDPATPDAVPAEPCSAVALYAPSTGLDLAHAMDLCQVTSPAAPLPDRKWGLLSA